MNLLPDDLKTLKPQTLITITYRLKVSLNQVIGQKMTPDGYSVSCLVVSNTNKYIELKRTNATGTIIVYHGDVQADGTKVVDSLYHMVFSIERNLVEQMLLKMKNITRDPKNNY